MDYRKAYWFEQPHMPGMFNVAVQPIVDPRDGRLHFAVPDSGISVSYTHLTLPTN